MTRLKVSGSALPPVSHAHSEQGFVKACGVRFMQKEIADMSVKEQQKYLKAKLADLGMTGRLVSARSIQIYPKG